MLGFLTEQVTFVLDTGGPNQCDFLHQLVSAGFSDPGGSLSTANDELNAFVAEVSKSSNNILLLDGSDFRFDAKSLERLKSRRWFNDSLILACLHLSDKLGYIRVGFCVPIHQQKDPQQLMARPFETAANKISEWHQHTEAEESYVCFFPLCQHENHFSLLEVKERSEGISSWIIISSLGT